MTYTDIITTEKVLRPLLESGLSADVTASGVSMFPLIIHGQNVRIEPLAGRAPRRGDIIAFAREDGIAVVHRIVWVNTDGTLVTRGDSCSQSDKRIDTKQIIGFAKSTKWFFININLQWLPIRLYGKTVLGLFPISNAINRFSAHYVRCIKHIFSPRKTAGK